jgi:hypothetical protein
MTDSAAAGGTMAGMRGLLALPLHSEGELVLLE